MGHGAEDSTPRSLHAALCQSFKETFMLELIPNQLGYPLLSLLIFLPVLGGVVLLAVRSADLARWIALAFSLATLALCVPLLTNFDASTHNMQFGETLSWIAAWNIQYKLRVDGISVLFVALTALLIGVWGGPNRLYAAIKFFLYTLAGSVLMLVAILAVYTTAGGTFDVLTLMNHKYTYAFQMWAFAAFFAAFAVKVPMFPFHTWLPDAHVEAPTAGSIILAGILIKMGAYGFLRFSLPFFPDAAIAWTPAIMALSVIAIIYGAYMSFAQTDFKKLIAYSSVSHMGFVTLGLFALPSQGLEGGILQMLNHVISTGALFLAVGVIYERTHTRQLADYGGIAAKVPVYAAFLMIITLSSIGLPGTNGFIGEFTVLLGAFQFGKPYAVIAALGVVLGAGYMLWMYQRVAFGKITNPHNEHLADMNLREIAAALPLVILVFWIGVYPNATFKIIHVSAANLIQHVQAKAQMAAPVATQVVSTVV